jgi:DNA modification methylase
MFNYKIYNEDCINTMHRLANKGQKVDIILTSPPYNTGKPYISEISRNNYDGRYDIYIDTKTPKDYRDWIVDIFNQFNSILTKNGVILWNVSYGTNATVNAGYIGLVWLTIADIINKTPFTVADKIVWKKNSALPNNSSKNKLTRIVEDIFVFARKDEYTTFNANKEISGIGKNGQTFYKCAYNIIEAPNNDGTCDLNKATYSSNLCEQLLKLYGKENYLVYDPFNGTGTTGVACKRLKMNYIGSEISEAQCIYSEDRLNGNLEVTNTNNKVKSVTKTNKLF